MFTDSDWWKSVLQTVVAGIILAIAGAFWWFVALLHKLVRDVRSILTWIRTHQRRHRKDSEDFDDDL